MIASTDTRIMAVIGDPIAHSLSPFMHSEIIREGGFDAVYLPFLVRAGETSEFAASARFLRFAGFNATMPHKQALLAIVDEVDEEAAAYGAVNTVKVTEGGRLVGYNTDVRGLFAAFEGRGIGIGGARVMVIGAGGVAGALVRGCDAAGVKSVTVLNRTYEKAAKLCDGLDRAAALGQTAENLREAAAIADIIVNCTSLGMSGTGSDFQDFSFLDDTKAAVCDLIYNPWETRLLANARERGLTTMNGIDMLIYQGILAFEIFMDVSLDIHAEHERLFPLCRARLLG